MRWHQLEAHERRREASTRLQAYTAHSMRLPRPRLVLTAPCFPAGTTLCMRCRLLLVFMFSVCLHVEPRAHSSTPVEQPMMACASITSGAYFHACYRTIKLCVLYSCFRLPAALRRH